MLVSLSGVCNGECAEEDAFQEFVREGANSRDNVIVLVKKERVA